MGFTTPTLGLLDRGGASLALHPGLIALHLAPSDEQLPTAEGARCTAGRLKYLLACGSAAVVPESPWEEFWYHLLRPGHHFVPVEEGEPPGS